MMSAQVGNDPAGLNRHPSAAVAAGNECRVVDDDLSPRTEELLEWLVPAALRAEWRCRMLQADPDGQ